MNCEEVSYYLPLYLSGELDARAMAEFEWHLGACPVCAEELRLQQQFDDLLRAAAAEQLPDARALRASVRRQMQIGQGWRRWFWGRPPLWLASLAALCVVTLAAGMIYYVQQVRVPRDLYAAAAKDHLDDVVQRVPKLGWRTSREQAAALGQEQFGDPGLIARLTPSGYQFRRVRMCNLNGNAFAHLIYEKDGGQHVSIFVRRQDLALPGAVVDTVGRYALHAAGTDRFQVVGFRTDSLTVLVVTASPPDENLRLAQETAARLA